MKQLKYLDMWYEQEKIENQWKHDEREDEPEKDQGKHVDSLEDSKKKWDVNTKLRKITGDRKDGGDTSRQSRRYEA